MKTQSTFPLNPLAISSVVMSSNPPNGEIWAFLNTSLSFKLYLLARLLKLYGC